jgi:hypothetical protein
LDKGVLVRAKSDDKPHEIVDECVVLRVGDTFGFDHQQALEGMDYFLNLLPLVGALPHLEKVSLDDLIDAFVFFDEDEQQVMSGFPHFGLRLPPLTFSSDNKAIACWKSYTLAGI